MLVFCWTLWLLSLRALANAALVVPIPRVRVDTLSVQDFDEKYLDREPVILEGASTCPANIASSEALGPHCTGDIGRHVHVKTKQNETAWAGLKTSFDGLDIDIVDFVKSMGKSDELRYVFDLQMTKVCPSLIPKVQLPAHLTNTFLGQFAERHKWDFEPSKCLKTPFYNMYFAEAGFETDLHVDAHHTSFSASMCYGQKLWRVVTLANFSAYAADLSVHNSTDRVNMTSQDGSIVNSDIRKPFETWSPDSPLHKISGLVIFEGLLSPGETLVIPTGAPHAAITLNNSLMVASNDQTLNGGQQWLEVCRKRGGVCTEMEDKLKNFQKYGNATSRASMSLLQATGCEAHMKSELEAATRTVLEGVVKITGDNVDELVSSGPLLAFKLSSNCIPCIRIRRELPSFAARFSPKLRIGVIYKPYRSYNTTSYKALVDQVGGFPEVKLLVPSPTGARFGNETLNFTMITYFGLRKTDMILAWASLHSGSTLSGIDAWWKLVLLVQQVVLFLLVKVVEACGYVAFADGPPWPGSILHDGGTIAVAGIFVGVAFAALLVGFGALRRARRHRKIKAT